MKTLTLHEIRDELVALDDWLTACREQIAELTREMQMVGYLASPPQSVSECLNSAKTFGWRKRTRGSGELVH